MIVKVIIVITAIICSSYAAPFSDQDAVAQASGLVTSRKTRDTLKPSMLFNLSS